MVYFQISMASLVPF